MGIINEYLKKIKEAVYGEEVRSSIHDAIEQCYKDATGHPESVAATVKEIGEVSANLSTERKRIDNLIATGTAQTQEIGKVIATTLQGSKTKINFSDSNVIYTSAFDTVKISDSSFARIDEDDGSPLQILKEGLYYLNASVEIKSEESTIPPTAYMILLEMTDEQYNKIGSPIRRIIDFPPNPTFTIERQQISYLFEVEKTTNLRFIVSSIADTSDKLAFSIDDIMITALDWKGKQSADLSELHDLRIEAGGTKHNSVKEAINDQLNEINQQIDAVGIAKNLFINIHVERVRNGITVNMDGHKISILGTATGDESLVLMAGEISDSGLETGKKYFVYGLPTDAFAKFQLKDKTNKEVSLENNSFTIPEDAIQLAFVINVKKGDVLDYTGVLRVYEKIYKGSFQEQIDTLNEQINAMQQIITKLVTAPTLTADTNGNLQITENEEG